MAAKKATERTAESGSAKKTPTKKTPTEKRPAKKASAKKAERRSSGAPRATAPRRTPGSKVAALAAEQLLELTGKGVEGITGLERTDDGWKVQVEVVEVRRIPDTTDVLALYEVEVDGDGELEAYHRLRRYTRGAPGEE